MKSLDDIEYENAVLHERCNELTQRISDWESDYWDLLNRYTKLQQRLESATRGTGYRDNDGSKEDSSSRVDGRSN